MGQLLHDRYYAGRSDRALDLVTGETVPIDRVNRDRPPDGPAIGPLVEVLDHGQEGMPRWVAFDGGPEAAPSGVIERAAWDGRTRGFVPVGADVYCRLKEPIDEALKGRTLLLIAGPSTPPEVARSALMEAALRSPRAHVLLSLGPGGIPPREASPAAVAREARSAYGLDARAPRIAGPASEDVRRLLVRVDRARDHVRAGRHAAAERLLREVIEGLVRRRAIAPAAEALITLGSLVLERGRARDAEMLFDEAAGRAAAARDEALCTHARIWQAAARTDLAHLTKAESLCRAVLLAGSLRDLDRARAQATLARILLWQARHDEAWEAAGAGMDHGDPFAEATAVRVLVERGEIFQAGLRARALVTVAERDPDALVRLMAATAHLRVAAASGDHRLAEAALDVVRTLSREARAPLRLVRARLIWAAFLGRCGHRLEQAHELERLARLRRRVPPLVAAAIDRQLRTRGAAREPIAAPALSPAVATAMVELAQKEESDESAVRRILEFVAEAGKSSRIDLCSADAGPVTVVASVGGGLETRIGPRVLEAGITIGPEGGGAGREIGVPVRLGTKLVAALVARWPADRPPQSHSRELIELAAAVAGPRVDGMLAAARERSHASLAIPELVGRSAAIEELRRAVGRAAAAPFAVLIEGESGVGKELVARAIHHLSPRRERAFCDVNCAALPDDLIESELFGHARGAFTGALVERVGLIETADGGTLFLDEVSDLSARAQAKLLRVLQQQEVRRVGEGFSRKVDVRVVSAANRDMRREAGEGRFRQDLLYRLDVIRLCVPPLRERPEDIPLLVDHFWRRTTAHVGSRAVLGPAVVAALARYHWPGNVRELQNVIAALAVGAPLRGPVRPALLSAAITGAAVPASGRLAEARARFERRFIEVALARAGGSRTRAARDMGLSRQGLLKMIARHGIGV
jgi:DNA-binding NtrC family response regulator/tetratricopeptide (TPR) repeat protein